MGNNFHDENGRFSSGANSAGSDKAAQAGDHLAQQPADQGLRRVPGAGVIDRSVPVTTHSGADSVGTSPRLSDAARANIIRNKAIDARHYGVASDTGGARLRSDTGSKTDLGKPQGGFQSKPGTFQVRARVKH